MTRSHFIEILMILTKYVFDVSVRLTEYSVTVESLTLMYIHYIMSRKKENVLEMPQPYVHPTTLMRMNNS